MAHVIADKPVPSYVFISRIHGPFLFGTTEALVDETADLSTYAAIVVLLESDVAGLRRARTAGDADAAQCVRARNRSANVLPNIDAALDDARVLDEASVTAPRASR